MLMESVTSLPVWTSFEFVQDRAIYQTETPYEVVGILPPEQESMRSNDTRIFSYENHGFEFVYKPELSRFELSDENDLKSYFLGIAELMKERFDAEEAIIYNYNFRKAGVLPRREETSGSQPYPDSPVVQVHTDGTHEGGWRRVRHIITEDEATKYLDGSWRIRLVTVWRPISVVKDHPLAILDPTSLDSEDLLRVARPQAEYVGELFYAKFNPAYRFYWLSSQTPEELLLFSAFDSEGQEKVVPHASFTDPNAIPAAPRESVDVRAIVISKKK